jgi:hypothetical protein
MASCTGSQTDCNGSCKDTGNDNNNCGACGNACGVGQSCDQGVCCDAGKTNCNGTCVDEQADGSNCGACGTTCGTGQTCDSGVCCGTGDNNCGGTCSDPNTDSANCGACGNACAAGSSCSSGLCCTNGTFNSGGICCTLGTENCSGACSDPLTDNNNCGACGNVCGAGTSCQAGTCKSICASGELFCNGSCINPLLDHDNCGACGTTCGTGSCDLGICCAAGQENCGGTCQTLGTNTHCSSCSDACSGGDSCTNDKCCPAGDNNCGGTCSDPQNDPLNCGACGTQCTATQTCDAGKCCANGTHNDNGLCCPTGQVNCGGVCKDLNSNTSCGSTCANAMPCAVNTFCSPSTHTCVSSCTGSTPDLCNGTCVNKTNDPLNCGTCGNECPQGATCGQTTPGVCDACPNGSPDVCPQGGGNVCTDTASDPSNCGVCGNACGVGQRCDQGVCCDSGLVNCGGTCVDPSSDNADCGACGNVCGTGETCSSGQCECPPGTTLCGGQCVTTSVDPNNCGACGNVCPAGKPLCVSNGCTNSCPAPLSNCGGKCSNPSDDNDNCGACGNKCGPGTGCSAGACVAVIPTGTPPAKCVNGGPIISVPTGGGGNTCTGSLGATAFTFGICSRTDIGPLSRKLYTDAFDSTQGPYVASCATNADCGAKRCIQAGNLCTSTADCTTIVGDSCDFPIKCVAGACAGGGIGVNGTTQDTDVMHAGGDFWVFGTSGESTKGDVVVSERMLDKFALSYSKTGTVYGASFINGPFSASGSSSMTLYGLLTTQASCSALPGSLAANGGCVGNTPFPAFAAPCGTAADLIPVKAIVESFKTTNDDAAINITPATLSNVTTTTRLDLPCGIYYFDSISIGKSTTIVVHGHTAIIVGGSIRISQQLILDLDPDATLDVFVGGVMNVSNDVTLGSPAYPRLTRMYFGDSSCVGGGGVLTASQDYTHCCSGIVSGTTCVGGGGNLSQAISLSQGGHFNGLLWAGYGQFTHSNPLEMYGSIFANYIDASGDTVVHYDNGAQHNGDDCPTTVGTSCESCRGCNNQACVNGACGACTADTQCCPPLVCRGGACVLNQ